MVAPKIKSVILALVGILCFVNCHHSTKSVSQEEPKLQAQQPKKNPALVGIMDSHGLWHPSKASYLSTESMLMWVKRPGNKELRECFNSIHILSKENDNRSGNIKVTSMLASEIENNFQLSHYCFYYGALEVDRKINKEDLRKSYSLFLSRYRTLRVFAKAMTQHSRSDLYESYIQKRYKSISQNYFGRQIQRTNDLDDF